MDIMAMKTLLLFYWQPARLHSVSVRPKQASQALRTAVRQLFNGLVALQSAAG